MSNNAENQNNTNSGKKIVEIKNNNLGASTKPENVISSEMSKQATQSNSVRSEHTQQQKQNTPVRPLHNSVPRVNNLHDQMKTATIDMSEWFTPQVYNSIPAATKERLRLIIENFELPFRLLRVDGCNEVNRNSDGRMFAYGSRFPDGKLELPTSIPYEYLPVIKDDPNWIEFIVENYNSGNFNDKQCKNFSTEQDIERGFNSLATEYDTFVNSLKPYLECEIPIIGHRLSGSIPPIGAANSFSLRRKADKVYTLMDYVEQGTITLSQYESIRTRIRQYKNILVVGSTGSGKTTFLNALANEMSILCPNDRIITIQEISELQFTTADKEDFFVPQATPKGVESKVDIFKLIEISMRRSPVRIVVGEVRGGEVKGLLQAWSSGHPGGLSSAHADNAEYGPRKIEQCLEIGGWSVSNKLIAENVNVVISIQKTTLMDDDGYFYAARRVDKMLDVVRYIPEVDEYQFEEF